MDKIINILTRPINLPDERNKLEGLLLSIEEKIKRAIIQEFGLKEVSVDNPYIVVFRSTALEENRLIIITYWETDNNCEYFFKVKKITEKSLDEFNFP